MKIPLKWPPHVVPKVPEVLLALLAPPHLGIVGEQGIGKCVKSYFCAVP